VPADPTALSQSAGRRRFGLGLRVQIVVALSVAFVVSFTLLGIASVRLTQHAQRLDRRAGAEAVARVLAEALDGISSDRNRRTAELCDTVVGYGGVAGVEVAWPGLEPRARGLVTTGTSVAAPIPSGGTVRVFVRGGFDEEATEPLTNLLLLYVALTGGAILLLAYVALTYLIVRPVSAVTRASERLASGSQHIDVPVRGAAEVARLAVAFNEMAAQLREERHRLTDRLAQLERMTAERDSAEAQVLRSERLASVGRLAAGVAHEIGNPLAAILGFVELLQGDGLDSDEQAEFLRRIHKETDRINHIIRNLLDFSRRGAQTEGATADLAEAIEDAASLVAPQKDVGQVTIERRLNEGVPPVRGSIDQLTQIVLNLLLNAADAIEGEGTISIELDVSGDGREAVVIVTDSGPGIPDDVLPHLFEPFVTTKPAGEGTGLGLAVCHTIVERLGGSITAANGPHGGARFEIRLPLSDSA
jgi:signal transduction histidine kinase